MGGLFSSPKVPGEDPEAKKARLRAERRAETAERESAAQARAKVKSMRTGGMRLLFSPARQEGETQTKLGGD